MQDRFKFRVWSKECAEYVQDDSDYCNIDNYGNLDCGVYLENGYDSCYSGYPELDTIVEQCTGLKDKNGKLIFEGDIVRHPLYCGKYCPQVVFENHKIEWLENGWHCDGEFFTSEIAEDYEVIGNIHENPELLGD